MLTKIIREYIGDDLDRVDVAKQDVRHTTSNAIMVALGALLITVGAVAITYMIACTISPNVPMRGYTEGMIAVAAAALGGLLAIIIMSLAMWTTISDVERDALDYWEEEGQIDYNPNTNGDQYD